MGELREKVARAIAYAHCGYESEWETHLPEADDVLAIPEIRDALAWAKEIDRDALDVAERVGFGPSQP